jgi:hypothetical protein
VGEQPSARASEWEDATRRTRSLKEQLRRARAKQLVAKPVSSAELCPGTALREGVDALLRRWVASRRIEPMSFVVSPDPFTLPEWHRYVVAFRNDGVVGFLSAIPAYTDGWLVEHIVCARNAPNGTAESMLHALHTSLVADGQPEARVSLGLAPLAGNEAWQMAARSLARPLFDFEGLRRFKTRLRPKTWTSVWLVSAPGRRTAVALVDVLTAFAGGSLVRFGLRSLLLHPQGLLWLLAVGLVPWTTLLLWLDITRRAPIIGYSSGALAAWVAFDVALAAGLFRAAHRPAAMGLLALLLAASLDALVSSFHAVAVGLGLGAFAACLRSIAVVAPYVGTTTLLHVLISHARATRRLHRWPA